MRPFYRPVGGLTLEPADFYNHSFRHCRPFATVTVMAVPKRRQSNARTGTRRAHDQKKPKQLHYCPKCSAAVPSHVICPQCGYYMGRVVVETEDTEE